MSPLRGLTLDAGALIGFEKGDERVRAILRNARDRERTVTVPTVVLVEAWRGGTVSRLAPLLETAQVEPLSERLARRAGELLARTGAADPVDAVVAVSAATRGDTIVTSDPSDIQVHADDLRTVRVVAV